VATGTRRRYTARTRAKAVGIAVVDGVTQAERVTGIPKQTIDYWLDKPEFGHLRTTAREKVIEQFWVGIQVGVEQVIAGLKGDAMLHHKADALRTLTEKFALLNGEATDRMESRDLTDIFDDHETRAIVDAAREYVGRAGSEQGQRLAPVEAVETGSEGQPTPADG